MSEFIDELKKRWQLLNLSNGTIAKIEDINILEAKFELKLPYDIKQYFLSLNGTKEEYDESLFCFYSIGQFQPVSIRFENWEGIPDYSLLKSSSKIYWDNVFVFSDYQFQMFCYAIELSKCESKENKIYILCGDEYKVIAQSFTEFIKLYLVNSDLLYFN